MIAQRSRCRRLSLYAASGQAPAANPRLSAPSNDCYAVAGSIRCGKVIEVLSELVSVQGSPRHFHTTARRLSRAALRWLAQANIDTAHIDPGKPRQNGNNESFNGKLRDECLSMEWLRNRIGAKIVQTATEFNSESEPNRDQDQATLHSNEV